MLSPRAVTVLQLFKLYLHKGSNSVACEEGIRAGMIILAKLLLVP